MRGHTGATILLGRGYVIGMGKKHKINAKSSTEEELIGANNALPKMM